MVAVTDVDARQFVRDWNDAMIRRSGAVVLCPDGTADALDAETLRQIRIARAAGKPVQYVTGNAARDLELAAQVAEILDGGRS